MTFIERYRKGEHVEVWDHLVSLGDAVFDPQHFDDAKAVADETMKRVRYNLESLANGFKRIGYQLYDETHGDGPSEFDGPTPFDLEAIEECEERFGRFPLAIRVFYDKIGRIDFMQSPDQFVDWTDRQRRVPHTELNRLSEFGPLVVLSAYEALAQAAEGQHPNSWRFPVVPDALNKAFCHGDWYYMCVTKACADGRLGDGLPDNGEFLIQHLRRCFLHGGFAGRPRNYEDLSEGYIYPSQAIIDQLAVNFLPI